jgi:hypothetical protein
MPEADHDHHQSGKGGPSDRPATGFSIRHLAPPISGQVDSGRPNLESIRPIWVIEGMSEHVASPQTESLADSKCQQN